MAEQEGRGSTKAGQDDQECGAKSETAQIRKVWSGPRDRNRTVLARALHESASDCLGSQAYDKARWSRRNTSPL
ncbi:hypothetical protein GCM10027601_21590 [Nocardioides ungokensis]